MSSCTYRIDYVYENGSILEGPTYRTPSDSGMTCVKFLQLVLDDLRTRDEYKGFAEILMSQAIFPKHPSMRLNFSCYYNDFIRIQHLSCRS